MIMNGLGKKEKVEKKHLLITIKLISSQFKH